ncbi:MAG: hypothetical protein ACT4OX_05300 [Actinomycetota bacterium]
MSRRALLLIGSGAAAVRVLYVVLFMRGYAPRSDAHHYYTLADAIANGHGFSHTLPFDVVHAPRVCPSSRPASARCGQPCASSKFSGS